MAVVAGLNKSLNTKEHAGIAVVLDGVHIYMKKKKSSAKGVLEKDLNFIKFVRKVLVPNVGVRGM